jgi:hypothetical protein
MRQSKKKKVINEYSIAWDESYNSLPKWKKIIIDDCIKNKKEDSIFTEFIKQIIEKAEKGSLEPVTVE